MTYLLAPKRTHEHRCLLPLAPDDLTPADDPQMVAEGALWQCPDCGQVFRLVQYGADRDQFYTVWVRISHRRALRKLLKAKAQFLTEMTP